MTLPDTELAALLPRRVAELVDVVGLPATLKLVELRGGGRLEVPRRVKPGHWLVGHIGLEALAKLVAYYNGERIEIDRCAGLKQVFKEKAILAEFAAGASNWELAQKYAMTERGVRLLRARVAKAPPVANLDLFEEFLS